MTVYIFWLQVKSIISAMAHVFLDVDVPFIDIHFSWRRREGGDGVRKKRQGIREREPGSH